MADTSRTTASAILMQRTGEESLANYTISYASRKLYTTRYPITELELLSIIFALTKFRHYVYGKPITIYSDHRPLVWLNSLVKHSSRLARWALLIQEYDITMKYIKGEQQLADCFTRLDKG